MQQSNDLFITAILELLLLIMLLKISEPIVAIFQGAFYWDFFSLYLHES